MNRRQAIAAWIAILAAGAVPQPAPATPMRREPLFDVWRECARFDREVVVRMQDRFAWAMFEHIDRQWRSVA